MATFPVATTRLMRHKLRRIHEDSFYLPKLIVVVSFTGGYGSWFDRVLESWRHKDEDNFLFLKYEDLHKVCIKIVAC